MGDVVIRTYNLSKRYKIGRTQGHIRYRTLRDQLADYWRNLVKRRSRQNHPEDTIWALKDVSFEVNRGEVVGIIGRNGAGKTTLLKILSRITAPTEGYAGVLGRVGSLLEVGTGFHPELTGRENIHLSGAILGMKRVEINCKFDEIVAFAEVEKFIDTPVKRYSSGMYLRLAFAVAAHLEPEILLVDEVLAVGDAAFRKKCLGKMEEVASEGRTVLFVSHNMAAIENICERAILLEAGYLTRQGATPTIIRHYLENTLPTIVDVPLSERNDRSGNGKVRFIDFHVEDNHGRRVAALQSGKDAIFVFSYSCAPGESPRKVSVGFGPFASDGLLLFVHYNSYSGEEFETIPASGQFRCRVPRLPLTPGRYRIGARITVGGEEADWPNDAVAYIDVEHGDFYGTGHAGYKGRCPFLVDGSWSVQELDGSCTEMGSDL